MRYFLTVILAFLPLISSAQSTKLLEIDASSFVPVQTGIIDGVPIDKIGMDPSRRPCARIKMHVNRMNKEEINGLSVRTVGGSVVVTKCVVASEGNGLIIELTAKSPTRFYLHHEKYGDSNEVSFYLEGNKEYRINAMLNTTHSIVVSSNTPDAEVYVDGVFKGRISPSFDLTVSDVYPGNHKIAVKSGSLSNEIAVEVNSVNIHFRINLDHQLARPQFVMFMVTPSTATLVIDNKQYLLNQYGEIAEPLKLSNGSYSYTVSAKDYHEEKGTFVVNGAKVDKQVNLKPAHGFLKVSGEGVLNGATIYVDGNHVGEAPWTSGRLSSGTHQVRLIKNLYKESTETIVIRDGETLDYRPRLQADFAKVTLKSAPGADIYVNDQKKGTSPWTGDLRTGVYTFDAVMAGHRTSSISQTISATPSSQVYEIPAPTPILGMVDIMSSPVADVYVDEKHMGTTPLSLDLIVGKHTVVFKKDGFRTQEKVIEVRENESSTVKVALEEWSDVVSLSSNGTANCYIVYQSGEYSFPTVKGNSSQSVGAVASAAVLWESFGTNVTPKVGDLIKSVSYKDGYITYQTADTFKEGNAVIAAKNAKGKILWSWHIWLTDQPQGQKYYNNAGTMMDRNLGATSATPGDVGALGLLYQWGRKDPFLGSSSISSRTQAKSTITWPSAVSSNSSNGTIAYATANPTTFITYNSSNYDWYYTGFESTDNTRWTTLESNKSIYDPCPAGWRVPDGGSNGIWSKALDSSSSFSHTYNSSNEGMNFSGKFGSASTIWYPASGYRHNDDGSLNSVGGNGDYWSASPRSGGAYYLYFNDEGRVNPSNSCNRANGLSVRCIQYSKEKAPTPKIEAKLLSLKGTANSYIVSSSGVYNFPTVKGNSSESVGVVASAAVLWESFGTNAKPKVGDLIKSVSYKDGYITYQTADTFKEGNAVIAAKDVSGKILWSWHIWLTDQPKGQVYFNNAGTVMDRNLGATSATPGDIGALGLLYQWGRKDPFLGSSSISSSTLAESTITWPSAVLSNSSNGTIAYATANPTTFITSNSSNYDWYYTGSSSTDNTRWTTSESSKSIYDPCPAGWRVPHGGVWSKALGSSSDFYYTYDRTKEGMNFSGKFGSASTIWYSASGRRSHSAGVLGSVGDNGYYWSASPNISHAYYLIFRNDGYVNPSYDYDRALGLSVRCLQVINEVAEP